MRTLQRLGVLPFAAMIAATMGAVDVHAQVQTSAPGARPAVVSSLLKDIQSVEEKVISLAEAIPEANYAWRPGEGVRSISEVMVHIAADNYFLPTAAGMAAPEESGIRSNDYATVQAYEKRAMSKAEAIGALRDSFAHLRTSLEGANDGFLSTSLDLFGTQVSGVDLWVMTTTHLHEHLGQLIAYARANEVVPPWSR